VALVADHRYAVSSGRVSPFHSLERMNHLSFRQAEYDFLYFELLVDGHELGKLVGFAASILPYWLIDGDLAIAEPSPAPPDDCDRIVGTCDCGEFGCGGTQARVTKTSDSVLFSNFTHGVQPEGKTKVLTFARCNYEMVLAAMTAVALDFAAKIEARRNEQRPSGAG